jgi:hypothetical protein
MDTEETIRDKDAIQLEVSALQGGHRDTERDLPARV